MITFVVLLFFAQTGNTSQFNVMIFIRVYLNLDETVVVLRNSCHVSRFCTCRMKPRYNVL